MQGGIAKWPKKIFFQRREVGDPVIFVFKYDLYTMTARYTKVSIDPIAGMKSMKGYCKKCNKIIGEEEYMQTGGTCYQCYSIKMLGTPADHATRQLSPDKKTFHNHH